MKHILLGILAVFILALTPLNASSDTVVPTSEKVYHSKTVGELFVSFYQSTGINAFLNPIEALLAMGGKNYLSLVKLVDV